MLDCKFHKECSISEISIYVTEDRYIEEANLLILADIGGEAGRTVSPALETWALAVHFLPGGTACELGVSH